MDRNKMFVWCIIAMSMTTICSFRAKYKVKEVPVQLTDPTAQRLYAIQDIPTEATRQIALEKIAVDNPVIMDSLYNKMLRDTVFLNRIAKDLLALLRVEE